MAHRHAFEAIRDLIHSIQPNVRESIRYDMPLFDYNGLLCGFSSHLQSISLYCRSEILEYYRNELSRVDVGKGRIRFKKLDDLP